MQLLDFGMKFDLSYIQKRSEPTLTAISKKVALQQIHLRSGMNTPFLSHITSCHHRKRSGLKPLNEGMVKYYVELGAILSGLVHHWTQKLPISPKYCTLLQIRYFINDLLVPS
jgi:hypothetical protein